MRDEYTFTDAGMELALTYGQVRDLAMRGELKARRLDNGRWAISGESLRQYRERTATAGAA